MVTSFQFLIGRLVTSLFFVEFLDNFLFQFLIGRLVTTAGNLLHYTLCSFNSS